VEVMVNIPYTPQEFIQINYLCSMRAIKQIELKISKLSPGLISELDRYLDFLINKRVSNKPKRLKQDWAGALKDIEMSSIELQKKALVWRQK
jgi:hypothetical protein